MPFDVHESQTHSQNSCKRDVKHSPYQPPGCRAGGGERTSAAEPSPLSPDSTIHIYGKGGERKEYIFRGLYNSSFAHRSLSFPSTPALRDGSYTFLSLTPLCCQHSQQKRRVWQCRCTPGLGHKDILSPHSIPTSLERQPPLNEFNSELMANTTAPKTYQRSITPHLECLYHLKPSHFRYPPVCTSSKPPEMTVT